MDAVDTLPENEMPKVDTEMEETEINKDQDASHNILKALEKIPEILDKLGKDNTQYELHVELIELLKQTGLPDQLEEARMNMHSVYPLSESLWLDWINDAKEEAFTEEGEAKLRSLYDKAEKDYLSIDIWKSFTEFVLEKFYKAFETMEEEDEDLIESTREDLTRAVRVTTQHIKRSQEIWSLYLQFEVDLMNRFKNPDQAARVKGVYLTRLGNLHLDCEKTFNDYSTYVTAWDNENYEQNMVEANKIYAETKRQADEVDFYEENLIENGYSLDAFYEYIEAEKQKKSFSLNSIRCLYERAILIYCTDPGLWNEYILFLIEKARVVSFLEIICQRAIRNCPWSGILWSHYIRVRESEDAEPSEINAMCDKALSSQLLLASLEDLVALLLAKCNYYRRIIDWEDLEETEVMDLRIAFEESLTYINEAFPKNGDPYTRLEKFYARILARLGHIDRAREIWEIIVRKNGRSADTWIQYIHFERDIQNYKKCVILFKKAMCKNLDDPVRLMDAWTSLEQEVGDLESFENALVRIHHKTKIMMNEWKQHEVEQENKKTIQHEERGNDEHEKRKKGLHRMEQKRKQKEKRRNAEKERYVKKKDQRSSESAPVKTNDIQEATAVESSTSRPEENNSAQKDAPVQYDQTTQEITTTEISGPSLESENNNKRKIPADSETNEASKKPRMDSSYSGRGGFMKPPRRGKAIALGPTRRQRRQENQSSETKTDKEDQVSNPTTESKSNDDFRAMLLGKK
ncbi:Squamous cell carcinoma antigen recognized by T-cells 3 [Rhizopus stolonifer]|uniref:Squamous cell carcinoma antigen recognized by T-cells 3 n=1 Tax=Rhizopus stolonifer TaxID=4846 RepID=A0A367K4N3_RHIST|nr:Squamous cell carcinoma antigen recognized by T-cells 3 [Rhizopus stolonifer]